MLFTAKQNSNCHISLVAYFFHLDSSFKLACFSLSPSLSFLPSFLYFLLSFFFLMIMGIEPRASWMLHEHSTTVSFQPLGFGFSWAQYLKSIGQLFCLVSLCAIYSYLVHACFTEVPHEGCFMPCATHLSQNNVDHLVKGKLIRLLHYTSPFIHYIFICVWISGWWYLHVCALLCSGKYTHVQNRLSSVLFFIIPLRHGSLLRLFD